MDNEEHKEEKKETIEEKLRELGEQINQMEKENQALYEELGISPHQLEEILSDPKRYSQTAYDFIQRERLALEEVLERRLREVRKAAKTDTPSSQVRGHWIFVR